MAAATGAAADETGRVRRNFARSTSRLECTPSNCDLEDFTVRLIEPSSSVWIARPAGQGRILDDDRRVPSWAVDDALCPGLMPHQLCECMEEEEEEGDVMPDEPTCIVAGFRASAPQQALKNFRWSTMDGTAQAGVDYEAVVDRVQTTAAGVATVKLAIRLLRRPSDTPPRWFYVRISAVSAVAVADAVAVVTLDDS